MKDVIDKIYILKYCNEQDIRKGDVLGSRVGNQDVILEQIYCRLCFPFPEEVCGSEPPGQTCIIQAGQTQRVHPKHAYITLHAHAWKQQHIKFILERWLTDWLRGARRSWALLCLSCPLRRYRWTETPSTRVKWTNIPQHSRSFTCFRWWIEHVWLAAIPVQNLVPNICCEFSFSPPTPGTETLMPRCWLVFHCSECTWELTGHPAQGDGWGANLNLSAVQENQAVCHVLQLGVSGLPKRVFDGKVLHIFLQRVIQGANLPILPQSVQHQCREDLW